MCGPYESVLGREVESVTATFLDSMKRRFPVAEGDVCLAGALVELDPRHGACKRSSDLNCARQFARPRLQGRRRPRAGNSTEGRGLRLVRRCVRFRRRPRRK